MYLVSCVKHVFYVDADYICLTAIQNYSLSELAKLHQPWPGETDKPLVAGWKEVEETPGNPQGQLSAQPRPPCCH